LPAMLGSFPGTVIFFGTYEYSKRHLIDSGITPWVAYLTSGMLPNEELFLTSVDGLQGFWQTLLLHLSTFRQRS
jgi:hypothetical protein